MVSLNIKLKVQKVSANSASIVVKLNGDSRVFNANIVNERGLFALELPSDLNMLLQQFPSQSKELVREIKERVNRHRRLQAA